MLQGVRFERLGQWQKLICVNQAGHLCKEGVSCNVVAWLAGALPLLFQMLKQKFWVNKSWHISYGTMKETCHCRHKEVNRERGLGN